MYKTKKEIAAVYYYIGFLCVMSLLAFVLYCVDKHKAKKGKWRIKEATLLGVGFFGGAVGALLAMYTIRHKTRAEHWYFTFVNVLGLCAQGVLYWFLFCKG